MNGTIWGIAALTASLLFVGCGSEPQPTETEFTNEASFATIDSSLSSASCLIEVAGDAGTCLSPADWKTQLTGTCGAAGGELGTVGYAQSCGNGAWRLAKYQCCGLPATPAPEASCLTTVIGNAMVCKPETQWKSELQAKCSENASNLTNVSFGEACDGGYQFAKFTCCDAANDGTTDTPNDPAPFEPPAVCQMHLLGDGSECHPESYWQSQGQAKCGTVGHDFGQVAYGAQCAGGGFGFAKVTCCPSDEPVNPTPPTEPVCEVATLGTGDTCVNPAVLKAQAEAACAGQGMTLSTMGVNGACGDGTWQYAKYTCCGAAPEPTTPSTPTIQPIDDAPEGCSAALMGSPDACMPEAVWKQYAAAACGDAGEVLSDTAFGQGCGKGNWRYAKYTCCQVPEQITAPNQCKTGLLENQCKTAAEWKADATAQCGDVGGALSGIGVFDYCGPGSWGKAKFTCCGAIDEDPSMTVSGPITFPEAELVCDNHKFGTQATCFNEDQWQELAQDYCSSSGAKASAIRPHGTCKHGSRFANITCCQQGEQCTEVSSENSKCQALDKAAEKAMAACETAGGELSNFQPGPSCGAGKIAGYGFRCCAQ